MRCLNQPDLSRTKITAQRYSCLTCTWISGLVQWRPRLRAVSHLEAWPPKTVSKLGFTPDGRKAKERILESAEML